jgi:hypothetical protein
MAGTTIYSINKPTVAGDSGVWGGFLNTGMDTIDDIVARPKIPFSTPTYNVGGTTTCDCSVANEFLLTVSGASTLAFSNVPSASFAKRIRLLITNGSAFVLTFPASVTWIGGIKPTFKASGVDEVEMVTKDAGTTWYATLRNQTPGPLKQFQGLSTTSTSDVSLGSFVLPAGTLAVNGQQLRITVGGVAQTQNCFITVKFGATAVTNFTATPGSPFYITVLVTRTGATTQLGNGQQTIGSAASVTRSTPGETLSGAVTIDFRGSVISGGTLNYDGVCIELLAVA